MLYIYWIMLYYWLENMFDVVCDVFDDGMKCSVLYFGLKFVVYWENVGYI